MDKAVYKTQPRDSKGRFRELTELEQLWKDYEDVSRHRNALVRACVRLGIHQQVIQQMKKDGFNEQS